jgi:hypothetical protein
MIGNTANMEPDAIHNIDDLIDQMAKEDYSILKQSPEGRALRAIFAKDDIVIKLALMIIFNKFGRFVANCRGKSNIGYRAEIIKLLKFLLPYELRPTPDCDVNSAKPSRVRASSKIFVINHPSDNEMMIAGVYSTMLYPEKRICYPVDLPRFEVAAPYIYKMQAALIDLLPILPPNSFEFMGKPASLEGLRKELNIYYKHKITDSIIAGDSIIIAPQTELQEHIFIDEAQYLTGCSASGKKVRTSVGSLLLAAHRKGVNLEDIEIIVMAVDLPKNAKYRQMNIFKQYPTYVGKIVTARDLVETVGNFHVDYKILLMMANDVGLPQRCSYPGRTN